MANGIEVSKRSVPADLGGGVDIDRSDGEAELGIEAGEIREEGVACLSRGVEDGSMKGRQLLPRRGMDPQPGIDLPEERLDLGRAPAGARRAIRHGPGIVVGAMTPDGSAAVVG